MSKFDKINYIITDKKRKNIFQIIIESIHASFLEKENPFFYFYNLLYKKNSSDYKNYIGMKKRNKILTNFYTEHQKEFTDKIKFNKILTSNNIPTPYILAYSKKYKIYHNSKEYTINNKEEFRSFLEKIINDSATKSIFIKPLDGSGGSHAFKFNHKTLNLKDIERLLTLMRHQEFIFQETIIQNNSMKNIYPDSINTLRIYTYLDREKNKVEIILALLRVGSKGSIVDNESMFVEVDIENRWTLKGDAKSFLHNGGKSYENHPDTGFEFNGFHLPFQEEIYKILGEAALLLPKDYIGWDVALSENGPTIIEANDRPHILMTQIMAGGFKGHPKYKKILKDFI